MRKNLPAVVALAVVIVWGVNFLLLKFALGEFRVLSFAFLRFAGMVALAWAVVLVGRVPLRIEPADRRRVAVAGLLGYTGYVLLALVGLSFTTAFSNALLIAAAPVFSVLLLALWRVEPIGAGRGAGLLLSLVGVAVFMSDKLLAGWSAAGLGDLVTLLASAFYAAYTVVLKPLTVRYPAALVTAWTLTIGAVPVLAVSATDLVHQDWRGVDAGGWSLLAWTIVVPVYLAYTLWSWATSRAGVAATNGFIYLVPVVTGLLSIVFFQERLAWAKVLGALLVLIGLVVVARLRKSQSAEPPEVDSLIQAVPAPSGAGETDQRGSSSPGRARPSQG